MKNQNISIFNLIEIFGQVRSRVQNSLNITQHCDQSSIHDFYCVPVRVKK